jgi:hypothetical protein
MRLFTVIREQWIVIVLMIAVIFGLAIWAIGPSPTREWLRSEGLSHELPVTILAEWAHGRLAPLTPIGFLTLFHPVELGVFLVLLAALFILVVLLPPRWRIQRIGAWLSKPITSLWPPRISVRVRTAMLLIAVLCLCLAWENIAWKTWRLKERYRLLSADYALKETDSRNYLLKHFPRDPDKFDWNKLVLPEDALTPAAQNAIRAYERDSTLRGSAHWSALAAAYGVLNRKYERAAADPSLPLAPDAPLPEGRAFGNVHWLSWEQYIRSRVDYDELIQRYPDLYWAHERKAWILATSPDASFRDGRRAVAAATRAAELTNWKEGYVLSTLAAACAEAGEFANAVRWQEQTVQRPTVGDPGSKSEQDRLALYKTGKPFRMPR